MHTLGMKFLLQYSSLLLFLLFSYSPKKTHSSKIQFHTLHISPADSPECHRHSTTGSVPNRMEVVDRYGACSSHQNQNQRRPTLAHALHLDQLRADSIQARLKATDQFQNANKVMKSKHEQSNLTVHLQSDDYPLDSLHYIVRLNLLGTQRSLSLVLDTGHGLTLTQTCSPPKLYDPDSSYTPIRCYESECFDFFLDQGSLPLPNPSDICAQSRTCDYDLTDASLQVLNTGTLSKVNLTDFPCFVFGCGHTAGGAPPLFGYGVDGVLGLGRGKLSFVSQTNNTRFSYCLPSTSTSTGFLTFGQNNSNDNNDALLSFTPFARPRVRDRSHYFVDIVAITVGETQLQIAYQSKIPGTVINTGLMITRLPPAAYGPMRDEFRLQMGTNNYPAAEAFSIFDTCYDTTNQSSITVPPVSFTFKNNVTVHLDVSGILYVVNSTLSCFAFAQASDRTDFVIFGSAQQRTLEMVFDVANDKLGFRQQGCA